MPKKWTTWLGGLLLFAAGLGAGWFLGLSRNSATIAFLARQLVRMQANRDEEAAYVAYRFGSYEQAMCAFMSYISRMDPDLASNDREIKADAARGIAFAYARWG